MADLLANASRWLTDMRNDHASQTIVYKRGDLSVEISATLGQSDFEIDRGDGIVESFRSQDFLVRAADLALDGKVTLPKTGDLVRHAGSDGTVRICEVHSPGNAAAWRHSDPHRTTIRIHTKQIAAQEVQP